MLPSFLDLPRYTSRWPSREEDEETSRRCREKVEEALEDKGKKKKLLADRLPGSDS